MIGSHDMIVAPATAAGGALGVIRLSGAGSVALCDGIFRGKRPLTGAPGHTLHYGMLVDGDEVVDDVVVSLFLAPHSYTGEESVEISCHGSRYMLQRILDLCIRRGARMAEPGEFTARAFLAGRMDLSQAEAVADLIAADSRAASTLAATQMRGHYSETLAELRERLLRLASLLELELDFSEEEVEFADRTALRSQMEQIGEEIIRLEKSFALGNALKEGVSVAIVGAPNVGKSTLLNRLVGDQRAMVSEIAGTTRDTIEECVHIDGVLFRFIDTAGLHDTDDRLEKMGIERTLSAVRNARIILRIYDASRPLPAGDPAADRTDANAPASGNPAVTSGEDETEPSRAADKLFSVSDFRMTLRADQKVLTIANKIDCAAPNFRMPDGALGISAKTGTGMEELLRQLRLTIDTTGLFGGETIVSNSRHAEALCRAREALVRALRSLDENCPTDLLCEDIRQVIHYLGTITGQITSSEILSTIFSKFCIGK